MAERPIIALDFPDRVQVARFLAKFPEDEALYVKIGMELFYSEGPDMVRWLVAQGHDVFLDLKLYDIPHTVECTMRALGKLGVRLTDVHAAGGQGMMEAAKYGLLDGAQSSAARLIAITQLTSTSEQQMQAEQLVNAKLAESVVHYAQLANKAGLDGVVCSALEAPAIQQATRSDFLCVTPGIRLAENKKDDQKRVVTPARAAELGSSQLVVGRPITQAADPVKAYQTIKALWEAEK